MQRKNINIIIELPSGNSNDQGIMNDKCLRISSVYTQMNNYDVIGKNLVR